jgi:hypothetical protein
MKRLFNEKEEWTDESRQFDIEIAEAVQPVIKKWIDSGYSKRDIQLAVCFTSWEEVLIAGMNK